MRTTWSLLIVLFELGAVLVAAGADQERNLLSGRYTAEDVVGFLVPAGQWRPYPTIAERAAWDTIPERVRADAIRQAETLVDAPWTPLPATLFLDFARNGNRSNYERASFARRRQLATFVFAEVFEDKGRFLDHIANGIWAICEESYWGVPAHVSLQRKGTGLPDVSEPTVDLFAAETGSMLAWTVYLLGDRLDRVSPLIRDRVLGEQERRILKPNRERDDFWWMGFGSRRVNNWNPWVCSNWLVTALLCEKDEARRATTVYKIMSSLDKFLNGYPEDGGCDEGPSYWGRAGASLFDCLELLHSSSGGRIDLYREPLVRRIGEYIYKVYIKDDSYLNFADAPARLNPEAGLVYLYGRRVGDSTLTGFGAFLARKQSLGETFPAGRAGSPGRLLRDLFLIGDIATATPLEPFLGEAWFPDLQVAMARSASGSAKGFYLAAKGGHNAESHNHNDVGNFIVYADGRPVLIDAGVGTYTAKTFSRHRYEIWTMQSDYHNLPTINGVMQKEGATFRARDVQFRTDVNEAHFSVDIAGAYPREAQVERWQRSLTLHRGKRVDLTETYELKEIREDVRLNFMTPLMVDTATAGRVVLTDPHTSTRYAITYDASSFSASSEEIPLTDARLTASWGNRLARVALRSKQRHKQGTHSVRVERLVGN